MRILCFLILFVAGQVAAAAEQPATVAMQAIKVGPHSYYVQGQPGAVSAENQGFMSNAGFVVGDDGVLVFDALGTRPLARWPMVPALSANTTLKYMTSMPCTARSTSAALRAVSRRSKPSPPAGSSAEAMRRLSSRSPGVPNTGPLTAPFPSAALALAD